MNGFSNQYYGWGGEDDDMSSRYLSQTVNLLSPVRSLRDITIKSSP